MATSSSFPLGSNPSRRRQTAKDVIDGFSEWTVESVMSFRAPDCVQEILPKSLGLPPRDNASWQQHFVDLLSLVKEVNFTVHDLLEDKDENKISMWLSSSGTSVAGPYNNEFMIVLYFDEAGEKLTRLLEFVDSKFTMEYFGKLIALAGAQESEA